MNAGGHHGRNKLRLGLLSGVPAAVLLLGMSAEGVAAQSVPESPAFTGANPLPTLFGSAAPALKATVDAPGVSCFELLRGNGGSSGYVLSHGAVLSETLSVHVDGTSLKAGQDYWLDPGSGSLFFASPIHSGDSVSVSYRYLQGAAAQAMPLTAPGLQLNLSQNTQLGLLFGLTSSDGLGFNTSLNGLALNSSFGSGGLSHYSSLAYFSNVQASKNLRFDIHPSLDAAAPPPAPATGQDHLLVQNLALQSGGFKLSADFQDVGSKFAGFAALKQGSQGNKPLLDQLTQLEKEKGIKRLGFGVGWSASPNAAKPGGLALNWSAIQDGKGAISQRGADFTSGLLNFHYAARDVDSTFTHFDGLREAEKTQWAREKGMQTDSLSLGLNFGSGKRAAQMGGLNFLQQRFADKSGSLQRDLWSLNTGPLGFSMFHRAADAGFKRLTDLADDDKTALALDVYRMYDPHADTKLVTAADRDQVKQEAGLKRDGLQAALALGKTGSFDFSQLSIAAVPALGAQTGATTASKAATAPVAAPGMSREAISLHTGGLQIDLLTRRTDAGFSQLSTLPDTDKRYLALDILRQFDPTVQLDKVTAAQKDQAAADELGLERTSLRGSLLLGKSGKGGAFAFSQLALTDTTPISGQSGTAASAPEHPSLSRQFLSFSSPRLQIALTRQSIADGFTRLTSLSDIEKAQYGNEHGLSRDQLTLGWQFNKTAKFDFSSLRIGATPDAVQDAVAQALKDSKDPGAAARTAEAGLSRQTYALTLKGLTLAANVADTAKDFSRASDLALPAADKQQIDAERGFRREDMTLHLDRIKGLTLDSYEYHAADAIDKLLHDKLKQSLAYAPDKNTSLSYTADSDIAATDGKPNGNRHSLLALSRKLDKTTLFKLSQDNQATLANGAQTENVQQSSLELDSDHFGKGGSVNYQDQNIVYADGKYQRTANLNLHAKPTGQLTFSYTQSDLSRSPDKSNKEEAGKAQIDENTGGYDLHFQATKQFAVVFGTSSTTTNDNKDSDTVSVGLQGQPFKDVTLDAKFNELHDVGNKNTKDVANVAISNTKPMKLGPLQDLTVKAGYVSLNDQRKLQNETMAGHAEWTLYKSKFLLDYNGLTQPDGKSTISRLYSFTTDPNPKCWFHGSFLYKDRTMLDGKEKLIRRFTADALLSKQTHFVYTYGTLPEDDKGNITPLTSADVSLKHLFRPNLTGSFFYRLSDNTDTKLLTRSLGLGLEGRLGSHTTLQLSLSKNVNGFSTRYDRMDEVRFSFDQKISADNYFSISTALRTHDGKGTDGRPLKDELRTDLDMNFIF